MFRIPIRFMRIRTQQTLEIRIQRKEVNPNKMISQIFLFKVIIPVIFNLHLKIKGRNWNFLLGTVPLRTGTFLPLFDVAAVKLKLMLADT